MSHCVNRRTFIVGMSATAFAAAVAHGAQTMSLAVPDWVGLAFDHGAGAEGLWVDIALELAARLRARGGPLLLVTITPATQIYGDLAVGRAQLAMLPLGVGAPPPGAAGAARRIGRVHGGFGYIAVTRRGRKVTKLSEFVGTAVGVPRGSCCFPRLSDDPTIEKVPMESEAAPLMTLHGRINASVVLDLDFAHYIDFHGFDPEEFRVARLYDPLEAWIFANDRVDPVIDAKLKDELATTMMKDQIAEMLTRYRISAPPMDGPQVTRIL